VVDSLVRSITEQPRGVAALICCGQAEASKSALMFGETASRTAAFTPRLPGPGQLPAAKAAGLVVHAFRSVFTQLQLAYSQRGGPLPHVRIGCVMLHMELLRDLLSPQARG
jgi:hypothetical protein